MNEEAGGRRAGDEDSGLLEGLGGGRREPVVGDRGRRNKERRSRSSDGGRRSSEALLLQGQGCDRRSSRRAARGVKRRVSL